MAEEAVAATHVTLSFNAPHKKIFVGEAVELVNIPGVTGDYGVTPDHAPTISELRPGLVQVFKKEGGEAELFFVPAGLAVTHPGSITEVTAPEAVSLAELDVALAQKNYAASKSKMEAAAEGSQEQAIAQIEVEVYESICISLGVNV